ncbi:MAG: hypothetical protein DWQ05_10415 [Calditrichaeota bacterium]|nr:MAG: hypothetical protein DWQ05_10415 [Calditrichota bacterium]
MQPDEIEQLITSITEKVVKNIFQKLSPAIVETGTEAIRRQIINQNLITEANAINAFKNKATHIRIGKNALITPLAKDYLQMKNIQIEQQVIESCPKNSNSIVQNSVNKIAILAPNCSRSEIDIIAGEIKKYNYSSHHLQKIRGFGIDLKMSVKLIAEHIIAGQFRAAIVLDESAFSLKNTIRHRNGIQTTMCWDVACTSSCQESCETNMLFINNRLLGFKKLASVTENWLKTFKT